MVRAPGVYPAQQDTWLLAESVAEELRDRAGRRSTVLELGTGSGALAVLAAGHRGARVTAVDVSRRALVSAGANAVLRGRWVRLRRGDLGVPVVGQTFDVVVSNPPYVPAATAAVPVRGRARAWDAGHDGRVVLDRLCSEAPKLLAPGGAVLLVQSALAGVDQTLHHLRGDGLDAHVVASCTHPFGPVLTARAELLEARGLIRPGQRHEDLAVIRATRPMNAPSPTSMHP